MNKQKNNLQVEAQKSTSVKLEKEKHFIKYVFGGLFVVIIIVSLLALIKIRRLQEENIKTKIMYESKLDSVHKADLNIMAKTFSWVIRGDLLRNNKDDAQLHLNNLLKEPHIKKAYIIDSETTKILLSTNKNEIGTPCIDFTIINSKDSFTKKGINNTILLISPVMNLNKKLGISVIEIDTKK